MAKLNKKDTVLINMYFDKNGEHRLILNFILLTFFTNPTYNVHLASQRSPPNGGPHLLLA